MKPMDAQMEARLREVVADTLGIADDEVGESLSPQTNPAWTSFSHLTLMSAVEEAFGIQFSMDDMAAAQSYPKLVALIGAAA